MNEQDNFNLYEIRYQLLDKKIRCYYENYIHALNIVLSVLIGFLFFYKFEWTGSAVFTLIPFTWLALFVVQTVVCGFAEDQFTSLLRKPNIEFSKN